MTARFHSITNRIVLILILLILPFNILSIVTTMYLLYHARQQTLLTMENLSSLAIQQIDSRLSAMNDLFYNIDRIYPDFRLYKEQGDRDGKLIMAETGLAFYFNTIVENDAFADVLFWKSAAYDRIYIGMDSLNNPASGRIHEDKEKLRDFLETEKVYEYGRWSILEIDDMTWLVKAYSQGDFRYGSMVSLDELAYRLKSNSPFEQVEILFAEGKTDLEVPEKLLCVEVESSVGNFRMQMRVPGSEGYASLTSFQLLCIGFVFLYVLLIPLLIYLIHRMLLRPLKKVSRAMEHLRNGEQEYRMTVYARDAERGHSHQSISHLVADGTGGRTPSGREKQCEHGIGMGGISKYKYKAELTQAAGD